MLFQRRLFLELLGNALATAVLMLLVLTLVSTVKLVHELEGLTLAMFATSLPVLLASAVDLVVPMAVLVSVILTYGRAAADNEIDALRASGVHPGHLAVPGLVFGVLVATLMLWSLDVVKPHAEREQKRMLREVDMALVLANQLGAGEPVSFERDTLISAESVGEDGMARGVRVQKLDADGRVEQELLADRAEMFVDPERSELVVTLYDYRAVVGSRVEGREIEVTRSIDRKRVELDLACLTTAQLMAWLDRPPNLRGGWEEPEVRTEVALRLSQSVSCVAFVLLGIPVALRFRRSDRVLAFLVAFLLALFLYYPSVKVSKALASEALVSPATAAWAGQVLLVLAAALFARGALVRR